MIPASYLFKEMFRQTWEEADVAPVVVENRGHFIGGLMTPIASAVNAVFHRRSHRPARTFSSHAYD